MTDLGGSLAVASRGLYATGVSTDLSVTYLASGGKVGDVLRAESSCDKCEASLFLLDGFALSFFFHVLSLVVVENDIRGVMRR